MNPPGHRKVRSKSRGYIVEDMYTKKIKCEWYISCKNNASSIHHIESSFRGKKKDTPDNLIALCNNHHIWIHNHNNYDNRNVLLDHNKKLCK